MSYREIESFEKKVINEGIKITEYKDKFTNLAFWGYNGRTYVIDMDSPGRITRETPDTWKSMILNLEEDD